MDSGPASPLAVPVIILSMQAAEAENLVVSAGRWQNEPKPADTTSHSSGLSWQDAHTFALRLAFAKRHDVGEEASPPLERCVQFAGTVYTRRKL